MASKKKEGQNRKIEAHLSEVSARFKEDFLKAIADSTGLEDVVCVLRSWPPRLVDVGKLKTQMERNSGFQPEPIAVLAQSFIINVLGEEGLKKTQELWQTTNLSEAKRRADDLIYEAQAITGKKPFIKTSGFLSDLDLQCTYILGHLENAGFPDKRTAMEALASEYFQICYNHLDGARLPFNPKGAFPIKYVEERLKLEA